MAQVKVIAKQMGYYKHLRQREGAVFFMDDTDIKKDKDGKIISPKWIDLPDGKDVKKSQGKMSNKFDDDVI